MTFLGAYMCEVLHHTPVHARVWKKWLLAFPVSEGGIAVMGKKDFSLTQMLIFKSKFYVLVLQLNRVMKQEKAAHCFDHRPKGTAWTTMR